MRSFGLTLILALIAPVVRAADVRVLSGFDYSPAKRVERVGENHFVVDIGPGFCNWFLFRIEGAEGRTITIDLKDAPIGKWKTLNPVYSYAKDIHALDSFAVKRRRVRREPRRAANGPLIPDTSAQAWHFVREVGVEGRNLRLTQAVEEDRVWLAMTYPYTCEYNNSFLDRLAKLRRSYVAVLEIARSEEGRPLRLVKIGRGGEDRKPCVLLYAREHPTEHDTSWVAEGAIRFLLSNTREARAIRSRFTFLVIPVLDPDGAVKSQYRNIISTFADGRKSKESVGVSAWIKKWVDEGKRLDLVFGLHNVESNEAPHLVCPMMEPASGRLKDCQAFHGSMMKTMGSDYKVQKGPWQKSSCLFRLSGFAARFYGALPMPYEVNSQAPSRHLTLAQLREVGARFVRASVSYFYSVEGRRMLADVTAFRRKRASRWKRYGHLFEGKDALYAEEWCAAMPGIEERFRRQGKALSFLPER